MPPCWINQCSWGCNCCAEVKAVRADNEHWLQGCQNPGQKKFEDQDVFNIFSKAATEDEGLVYLNVFKLILFLKKYTTTKTITQSLLLDFVTGKFDKV